MQTKITEIKHWDWLLVCGLICAPMTGLRIWKIGPAEVMCFVWGLRYFPRRYYRVNILTKFFFWFLLVMGIGTVIGYLRVPNQVILSDGVPWLYLGVIALAMYDGLKQNSLAYNELLLRTFSRGAVLWYLFLWGYSRWLNPKFFGAFLWYGGVRYTGGGSNPHQLAVLMCGLVFCFVRELVEGRTLGWNLLYFMGSIFIVGQTKSSTGYLALTLGAAVTLAVLTTRPLENSFRRGVLLLAEFLSVLLLVLLLHQWIFAVAMRWIESDPNGLGRLEIFSHIKSIFKLSPLFGLGPGEHSAINGNQIEFHNTYLEVLAATGLVGMMTLIIFTIQLIKRCRFDLILLAIVTAMYVYGFAGFAMRRLAYWGLIVFVLVLGEQITNAKLQREQHIQTKTS
ncbi:O-antigen ligase family protein [Ligilactobacillus saerimneri]|uniref:O-antigen ligase family protein n=1 Tax=Ligilactobacillus saerimneri TaxID=228229 RepID=UPI0024B1A531|nr:O-antigen ligase family protein [Ligilactobacillus saerimneri]MDI9205534.1 O-antigen ligase family protein [Ligilactobacillus saerimneri]